MNDTETNHTEAALSDQIAALKCQVFILLLALIVVSGALATYLYYQSRVMNQTLEGIKPQAIQTIQTYKQVMANFNQASVSNFMSQISVYAATHPDFQPVLKKYGWNPPAAAPAAPKK